MTKRAANWGLLGGVGLAALAWAGAAAAQDSSNEDIIVTANKRPQALLDYAGSISAVTAEDITERQTLDLQDLSRSVAGLSLQQGGTVGLNRVVLRGLNSGGDAANVAIVVDDAPLTLSGGNTNGGYLAADFNPYDMARIEVLRGPQGTLYGATAEGGLIRYVTNAPDTSGFAGGIEGVAQTIESGDTGGTVRGYVNVPLAANIALRGNAFYDVIPGWIDNDEVGESDLNEAVTTGGRLSALFNFTPGLSLQLGAMYQETEQDGDTTVQVNGITDPTDPFGLVDGLTNNTYTPNRLNRVLEMYSAAVDVDLGFADFRSISSYGVVDVQIARDLPTFAGLLGPDTLVRSRDTYGVEKFSQEFRLLSQEGSTLFGNQFEWILGAFYTNEEVPFVQNFRLLDQPTLADLGTVALSELPSEFEDTAIFADATYYFTPSFDVEFGIRYSESEQNSQLTQGGILVGPTQTADPFRASDNDTSIQITPRWRMSDDAILYARYAQGYRPGGPSIPIIGAPPGQPESFSSDSTENYEIGVKGSFIDDRLTLDLAGFYIEWTDIQILTFIDVNGTAFVQTGNAGEATSQGIEWNVSLRPIDGLELGVVGAITDTELLTSVPLIGATEGDALPYVADLTNTVNVDYEWNAFGGYEAFVGASWSHVGERFTDFPFHIELPSYDVFDARAGLRGDRYAIQFFAKNLNDERGMTSYAPLGGFANTGLAGLIRPRTIGVRLSADF